MLETFLGSFDLPITARTIIGLVLLCAAFAPLSIFVVQRGLSLGGEALTHGMLPGLWLAFSISGSLSLGLVIGGYATAWLIVELASLLAWRSLFKYDAILGSVYIPFYALGVVLVSISPSGYDFLGFIKGTPLGISWGIVELCLYAALVSLPVMAFLRRPLTLQSQDPAFFSSLYRPGWVVTQAFMAVFVFAIVTAVVTYGILFAIALAIFPGLTARVWANSVGYIWLLSFVFGLIGFVGGFFVGLLLSDLATGPLMVLTAAALWLLSYLIGPYGLRRSLQSS